MGINGGEAAVDELARERADKALDGLRAVWEAQGGLLRELQGLRKEVHDRFNELRALMRGTSDPPPAEPWGRRSYDPDEEVTAAGTRIKVPIERFRRMEQSLAEIRGREATALRKEQDAALKAEGAAELERRWKRRIFAIAPAIGTIAAGVFELIKWLLSR